MKLTVIKENRKKIYEEFCENNLIMPVFSEPWWLDAVTGGGNWDIILIIDGKKEVVAVFPFVIVKKRGVSRICMPQLTQKLGPWLSCKIYGNLSLEKKVFDLVISSLPRHQIFSQNWDHRYRNWLPFYWNGFSQTTRYTYLIKNIINSEKVYKDFDHSKKKQIKKALAANLAVSYSLSPVEFYEHHKLSLKKENKVISYSYEVFNRIYIESVKKDQGLLIGIYNKEKTKLFCALFIVYDKEYAYNLISTIDPEFSNNGGSTLVVFEAIKWLSGKTQHFDFEGSMIEPVERSFRRFGATQVEYYYLTKTNGKLLKLLSDTKKVFKK